MPFLFGIFRVNIPFWIRLWDHRFANNLTAFLQTTFSIKKSIESSWVPIWCAENWISTKNIVSLVHRAQGVKPSIRPAIEMNKIGFIKKIFLFFDKFNTRVNKENCRRQAKESLVSSQNYKEWFCVISKSYTVYLNLESERIRHNWTSSNFIHLWISFQSLLRF